MTDSKKSKIMMNPILRREGRAALRNWRFFGAITLYAVTLTICIGFILYSMIFYSYDLSFDPSQAITLYNTLCCFQFGVVVLATPAIAAGSISGERERQTLDLLLTTRMSAFSIVTGKLMASLSQLFLIMVAGMPVFAIVFYFGGLSLYSFATVMGYILLTACLIGAVSLFFSCLFKRTSLSIMLVYLLFGFLCVGTLALTFFHQILYINAFDMQPSSLFDLLVLTFNPGAGFLAILFEQTGLDIMNTLGLNRNNFTSPATMWVIENFYILNIGVQLAMTALFLWLSTKFIYPVRKRKN